MKYSCFGVEKNWRVVEKGDVSSEIFNDSFSKRYLCFLIRFSSLFTLKSFLF